MSALSLTAAAAARLGQRLDARRQPPPTSPSTSKACKLQVQHQAAPREFPPAACASPYRIGRSLAGAYRTRAWRLALCTVSCKTARRETIPPRQVPPRPRPPRRTPLQPQPPRRRRPRRRLRDSRLRSRRLRDAGGVRSFSRSDARCIAPSIAQHSRRHRSLAASSRLLPPVGRRRPKGQQRRPRSHFTTAWH